MFEEVLLHHYLVTESLSYYRAKLDTGFEYLFCVRLQPTCQNHFTEIRFLQFIDSQKLIATASSSYR